jgi:hypothetical protein
VLAVQNERRQRWKKRNEGRETDFDTNQYHIYKPRDSCGVVGAAQRNPSLCLFIGLVTKGAGLTSKVRWVARLGCDGNGPVLSYSTVMSMFCSINVQWVLLHMSLNITLQATFCVELPRLCIARLLCRSHSNVRDRDHVSSGSEMTHI